MSLDLNIPDTELDRYRDAVNPARHVRAISAYEFSTVASLLRPGALFGGDALPWPKTHGKFAFRKGEVTLWHGINGHGKSAVTTQVAAYLATQDKKSCLASFEMLPVMTCQRMVKQVAGNGMPTESFAKSFFAAFKGRIWLYDRRDRVDRRALYAVIRYTAIELGVEHFWIDSLMKCVAGEDDYNGQKDFVGDLCSLSHELNIHIHLVHHVRKSGDEKAIPSKFDAKGSGAITDQVDNVLAVWRNKGKEAAIASGKTTDGDGGPLADKPDFLLICDKQRNGGWEGRIALWGDLESWHFRESSALPFSRGYVLPDPIREPGQDEEAA